VLARWFEIANIDEALHRARGGTPDPEFLLGSMATVWSRLGPDASPSRIRAMLAASPFGDPGDDDPRLIQLGTRLSYAGHVAAASAEAGPWALGGAALLVAREQIAEGRRLEGRVGDRAAALLGRRALAATSVEEMAQALPAAARWALEGVTSAGLWTAEERWWSRVERDGFALLAGAGFAPGPVIGAAALLAADAHHVLGALESASRGGTAHDLA
jgi:hypothetical protein